ncbi:unnamed protein product [Allacma fusca]|uniref:Uncharacterized protein n=1 Tax=Allacma fusca TaxID=39272 RepID=A0A8J2LEW7_9HEXA|nr:unnamed protein product [Allacma fusca]
MYGRKLKVKKKSKTGIKSNDGGSNWGPRVALYEREREQATHQQYVQKQQVRPPQQHNQASTSSSASVSNSATYSTHYGLQDKYSSSKQRLKEKENNDSGIVPSSINSHYSGSCSSNYHQRALPINVPLPTSAPARPGKQLPSSGNSLNSSNGNLSKPLTVIIPPPEHFPVASDFGPDRHSSVPSTKTWRSSPDHQPDIDNDSDIERGHTRIAPPPEFGKNVKQSSHGPLSPTIIVIDSPRRANSRTEHSSDQYETRQAKSNENADERDSLSQMNHLILEATPEKVSGAAISALAQGLAMVYVPMESTPVPGPSSSSKPLKKTAEQQAVENLDDVIDSISRSGRSSTTGSCTYSTEPMEEPKVEKPLLQTVALLREKESEMDSLLESFDSVMFKPKPNAVAGINPGICGNTFNNNGNNSSASTNSPNSSDSGSSKGYENTRSEADISGATGPPPTPVRVKQQISESPPPLPPPNIKPKKPDKNLRFSEQLENIHQSPFHRTKLPRLGKKVSIPTTPETQSQHSQQDTQSVTTEVVDLKRFNTMSTGHASESSFPTVLSCGHMKTSSNYSTLSSVTSSLTDDDHDDRNSKRDSRSAIQQLRDLSILIGGGQNNSNGSPPVVPTTNNKDKVKSEKHRRDSQGSSGTDSGKGSGSSPTETSPKDNKNSYGIPCAFSKSDCDDCYKVFKNPLAIDSSCSHSSGTSPLSSQDRCENYHRHLIIQEQSRLKHSAGKSRSHNLSSQGSSSGSSTGTGGMKKSKKSKKHKKTHQLVFEYCDCRHCDCSAHRTLSEGQSGIISSKKPHQDLQLVVGRNKNNVGLKSNNDILNTMPNGSNGNGANRNKRSPGNSSSSGNDSHPNNSNLFTIDEEEIGEVGDFTANPNTNQKQTFMDVAAKDLNSDEGKDHWHPKCWLATDATMGWSDLESLYSQNVKLDKPQNINDECWTCWKEIAENRKFTGPDANRTVDRTKRMFIWLNKRHKEFNAPWWEVGFVFFVK